MKNQFYSVDFETFNRDFFSVHQKKRNVKFFDRMITRTLKDKERVAEIKLITTGTVGNYTAYEVKISHKQNGTIATHCFLFSEYFNPVNRVDNRKDFKGSPHISVSTCRDGIATWYICVPSPSEITALADRIWAYIDLYE